MMKTFSQIKDGKAHWIFQAEEIPEFAPDIVIVDISDIHLAPAEGWRYDGSVFSPPPSALSADQVRGHRDALLISSEWIVQRNREQVEASIKTSLTPAEYLDWIAYRQELRDLTKQSGFPESVSWPEIPTAS